MINWKLRLKNKTTLLSLIALAVTFIYTVLGMLGIVPSISQEKILEVIGMFVQILVALGIVVDPTTSGVGDSQRALTYDEPRKTSIDEYIQMSDGSVDYTEIVESEEVVDNGITIEE